MYGRTVSTPGPVLRYYAFRISQSVALTLPIFVVFFQSRGLNLAAIGVLEATYSYVVIAAEAPTGYVGDRIGRRTALAAGAVLGGLGALLYAFAQLFAVFLVAAVVRAVGGAFSSGTAEAWLYETLQAGEDTDTDGFSLYSGRANALGRITSAAAAVLGGVLYSFDPLFPWLLEAGIVSAGAALAFGMPPSRSGGGAERDDASPDDEEVPGERLSARETLVRAGRVLGTRAVRWFVVYTALLAATGAGAFVLVQPASVDLAGIDPALLGVVYAVLSGAAAVGGAVAGRVREQVGIATWFALAPPALGATFLVVFLWPPAVVCVFVLVWAVRAVSAPLEDHYLNDHSGSAARATVLSGAATVHRLLTAPAKIAVGAVAAGGGLAWALGGLGGALLAASVAILLVRPPVETPIPGGAGTDTSP